MYYEINTEKIKNEIFNISIIFNDTITNCCKNLNRSRITKDGEARVVQTSGSIKTPAKRTAPTRIDVRP